jgi:hypothetical protein
VMEDYVSREAARDHYGVVLKEDLSLDEAATAKLRNELCARRKEPAGAV